MLTRLTSLLLVTLLASCASHTHLAGHPTPSARAVLTDAEIAAIEKPWRLSPEEAIKQQMNAMRKVVDADVRWQRPWNALVLTTHHLAEELKDTDPSATTVADVIVSRIHRFIDACAEATIAIHRENGIHLLEKSDVARSLTEAARGAAVSVVLEARRSSRGRVDERRIANEPSQ